MTGCAESRAATERYNTAKQGTRLIAVDAAVRLSAAMVRRYLRIPDEGARQPASRVAHPAGIS